MTKTKIEAFIKIYLLNFISIILLILIGIFIYFLCTEEINKAVFISLITLIVTVWFSFLTPFDPRLNIGKAIFVAFARIKTNNQHYYLPCINVQLNIVNNNAIGGIIEDLKINVSTNGEKIGDFFARRTTNALQAIAVTEEMISTARTDIFGGITVERRSAKTAFVVFMPNEGFINNFPNLPYNVSIGVMFKISGRWQQIKKISYANKTVDIKDKQKTPYGILEAC